MKKTLSTDFDWSPGVLSDRQIDELAVAGMITQGYSNTLVSNIDGRKIISYGLSSYGYDARIAPEFLIIRNKPENGEVIDPKQNTVDLFERVETNKIVIPPNSFVLTRTVEYFNIPDDVLVTCIGKSTYARVGCIAHVTPLEPGWKGHVTLEFSNSTPFPLVLYANEGGVQFVFNKGSSMCNVNYRDRGGKYQGQTGITPAIVN